MKQLFCFLLTLLSICFNARSQSSYSEYNGKTWEQLAGSGKMINMSPAVDSFNNIEIGHMNVKVLIETGGKECNLQLSIDDNLAGFFRSRVVNKTLQLSMDFSGGKYDRWLSSNNTVVTIKAPFITSLVNKGNTGLEVNIPYQPAFTLVSNGNPDIILNGQVGELFLQSSGNANIQAGNMLADKIMLSSNGNADIEVNAKEIIKRSVNGNNEISNLFNNDEKVNTNKSVPAKATGPLISFRLKNNSLLPARVALISYRPDENGNGTSLFTLISMGTKKLRFPEGTKIYIATPGQVNTVMSGASISGETPFLTVKKEDGNKTFPIN